MSSPAASTAGHCDTVWFASQVVIVCVIPPSLVHVTVVPTVIFLTFGTKPQFPELLQKVLFQIITLGLLGAAGGLAGWLINAARVPTTRTTTTTTAAIIIHFFLELPEVLGVCEVVNSFAHFADQDTGAIHSSTPKVRPTFGQFF